jgi:TonB family protein
MKRATKALATAMAICAVALLVAVAQAQTKAVDEKGNPVEPKILKKVPPAYPAEAKKEKVEGAVTLQVKIDETGKVTDATVSKSPDERLSKAAIDAVKQWEFEPGKVEGKPVKVKATITVNFRLK